MSNARTLINTLGIDAIAAAVPVEVRTVANKGAKGFPAYWWPAISALCAERGIECPREAFAFQRRARSSTDGAAA